MKYKLKDALMSASILLGALDGLNLVNTPFYIYIGLGIVYAMLRYFDQEFEF